MTKTVKNIIRALRLPFTAASILPFILGSLLARESFQFFNFLLGLLAVVAAHLSANLINDYADSRSGLDWRDRHFYRFFGGSKLIQEKIFSERFYLIAALICFGISGLCIVLLAIILKDLSIFVFYFIIMFLAWAYSQRPLQFSYRKVGEIIIFILFGPALVMGGYFIQTKIFPTKASLLLSLPFGFLTTAILFANEIPDYLEDKKSHKFTWVDFVGQKRAFLLYAFLMLLVFLSIILSIILGYLSPFSFLSLVFIFPAIKATRILKKSYDYKIKLIQSSKLTILVHTLVSAVLILDVLLCIK